MKKSTTLLCALMIVGALSAQTTYHVSAQNDSFSPNSLSISVGDSVIFTNVQGTHNVNGTTATFPSNPASFGNSVGTGWTYGVKFTVPGHYDYRCDLHFSMGMTGTIDVSDTTMGISENSIPDIDFYPNPTRNNIYFNNTHLIQEINVCDILGNKLMSFKNISQQQLNLSCLPSGVYFLDVVTENNRLTKRIVKE